MPIREQYITKDGKVLTHFDITPVMFIYLVAITWFCSCFRKWNYTHIVQTIFNMAYEIYAEHCQKIYTFLISYTNISVILSKDGLCRFTESFELYIRRYGKLGTSHIQVYTVKKHQELMLLLWDKLDRKSILNLY